jgi:hypothetical protein
MCCNEVTHQQKRWANEICRRLRAQYGESTLSKTHVKFWHKAFRGGRDAMQTQVVNDAQGQESPPESIAAVRELIEGNCWLTVVEICQYIGTCISYGSMQSIIKNELEF